MCVRTVARLDRWGVDCVADWESPRFGRVKVSVLVRFRSKCVICKRASDLNCKY